MSILVFAEQRGKQLRKAATEVISQGRVLADKLGQEVAALLVGSEILELADEIKKYNPHEIYLADDPALEIYQTETYVQVLKALVQERNPTLVMMAHTIMAKDLAPRVAQRVGAGLLTDCIDIQLEDGGISFVRPVYGGKALARMKITTPVQFATLRPNTFPPIEMPGEPAIKDFNVTLAPPHAKTTELDLYSDQGPELTEADIIVSGGRGLGHADGFDLIRQLAEVLGAAVGASRSAVDAGWISHPHQVGQTGKKVSPKCYMAMGISGAIQHLAGMGSSKCIVAVNKDREANIFNVADYGILGDLYEVIPIMTEQLEKMKSQ